MLSLVNIKRPPFIPMNEFRGFLAGIGKELGMEMVRHLHKYMPPDGLIILWLASMNDGITALAASPSFKNVNKSGLIELLRKVASYLESGGDL